MNTADEQYRMGLALLGQGRVPAAAVAFERATTLAPDAAPAHHMLGVALQRLGRIDEAEAAITRAIGHNDRQPDYYANRAIVRCGQQRFDDAVADAEAALRLAPQHLGALCNLGLAHMGAKRFKEAAAAFTKAVRAAPGQEFADNNLALAIGEIDNPEQALEAARAYVEAAPLSSSAYHALGLASHTLGDYKPAAAAFGKAARLAPNDLAPLTGRLFMLNYLDDATDDDHLTAIEAVRASLARIPAQHHRPVRTDADRPLRIGFVSGDLREHSVSQFLLGLLPHLAASSLTLAAYPTLKRTDEVTAKLKPSFAIWSDISDLSDADAAAKIRSDGIDILFDLSGYTRGSRPQLFAMRPAPIAVSWLGYSATTANPSIDYVLCNDSIMPRSEERFFVERPLRLAGSYLCFTPPPVAPPALANSRRFAFGSFNLINKLSDRTVGLYSRILTAVPDSDLILKTTAFDSAEVRRRTTDRFAAHGVDPARLQLLNRTKTRLEHLGVYGRLSLALDPWPYSGTTTTMEALAMGVPVLTLNEGRFISRVSASLLATAGLDEWIATDEDDYVGKAVAAAQAPDALASIRPAIRQAVINSPLCDPEALAENFRHAMREIWRRWCNS